MGGTAAPRPPGRRGSLGMTRAARASGGGTEKGEHMHGLLSCGRTTFVWLICLATIGGMAPARDTAAATLSGGFLQASDGLVSIEAEHYDANVANGGQSFVASSEAGFSGSGALGASPNNDVVRNTGYAASSPRLEYRVICQDGNALHLGARHRQNAGR